MSRCLLAALTLSLAFALPASAQVQRNFPQDALRGTIAFGQSPEIKLNGQPTRMAPGHRIRNQDNMLEMSAGLMGKAAVVNYTLDTDGLVKQVWILRKPEIAVSPWPTTPLQARQWAFDPVAQTWTRP
jgi:hypothetical protein